MTEIPPSTLEAAKSYVLAGLSVIPIKPDGQKAPAYRMLPVVSEVVEGYPRRGWGPFTKQHPTISQLELWFGGWANMRGIAVVCGHVSGNLEAIDIDSTERVEPWLQLVRERAPSLLDQLVLVRTPRPGLHCYYRCSVISGCKKLAYLSAPSCEGTDEEIKAIAEIKGEGGYALIPPSPGICHPSGRPYLYGTSRTLLDVREISPTERELLLDLTRSLGNATPRQNRSRCVAPPPRAVRPLNRDRPGDDFCVRTSWTDLLEAYGWSLWDVSPEGVQYWTRPGKSEGNSASVGFSENDRLYVFTSSIPELEPQTSYDKFSFLAHMEYGGDFKRAAKALMAQGYGKSRLRTTFRPRRQSATRTAPSSNRRKR